MYSEYHCWIFWWLLAPEFCLKRCPHGIYLLCILNAMPRPISFHTACISLTTEYRKHKIPLINETDTKFDSLSEIQYMKTWWIHELQERWLWLMRLLLWLCNQVLTIHTKIPNHTYSKGFALCCWLSVVLLGFEVFNGAISGVTGNKPLDVAMKLIEDDQLTCLCSCFLILKIGTWLWNLNQIHDLIWLDFLSTHNPHQQNRQQGGGILFKKHC